MPDHLLIVEQPKQWKPEYPDYRVIGVKEYLSDPNFAAMSGARVINLCPSRRYLSLGYYCSLLAEARGHKVIPSVRTIQDLSRKSIYSLATVDLDRRLQRLFTRSKLPPESDRMELPILFGRCPSEELQAVARELFEIFPAPLLSVEFRLRNGGWRIDSIRTLSLSRLASEQEPLFLDALAHYLSSKWVRAKERKRYRYDLAILHNPSDPLPPSNQQALKRFVRAAAAFKINAELITPTDFGRIAEYDALFIRETTRIDHHTYRFAKRAAKSGMVVIDDPDSILKCTNKVFLAELLAGRRVASPRTIILRPDNLREAEEALNYPMVLKIPDGAFSAGVFKVENRNELEESSKRLFKESDLLLAQEYTYTEFDWRVGILNRKPLYVCKYFMSHSHWQIINHSGNKPIGGHSEALPLDAVPPKILKTALKAANLIGDGLYGVDLKETKRGVLVIEVNDNPSLDAGAEDELLGDALYRSIMAEFYRRLESR